MQTKLTSTMHTDPETGNENEPEVITFYNVTKGGVDVLDRMEKRTLCEKFSDKWPLSILNGLLLNIVGTINSHK